MKNENKPIKMLINKKNQQKTNMKQKNNEILYIMTN